MEMENDLDTIFKKDSGGTMLMSNKVAKSTRSERRSAWEESKAATSHSNWYIVNSWDQLDIRRLITVGILYRCMMTAQAHPSLAF